MACNSEVKAQLKLLKSKHCKYLLSTGVSKEHALSQLGGSLGMGGLVSESKHNNFGFCQNSLCLCNSLHLLGSRPHLDKFEAFKVVRLSTVMHHNMKLSCQPGTS